MEQELLKLKRFRERLYHVFDWRADALMDLVDGLAANQNARSVAELSLEISCRFGYGSLYAAIDGLVRPRKPAQEWTERKRLERRCQAAVADVLARPQRAPYWTMAIDGLSVSRPHAGTLHDRGYVHQADAHRGARPVTVGHAYSLLVALPEKTSKVEPPWAVPLSTRRVATHHNALAIAVEQVVALMEGKDLPWHEALCVVAADAAYSVASFLGPLAAEANLVVDTRLRSNRTLYRLPKAKDPHRPGRPRAYGEPFKLNDPSTRGEPDEVIEFHTTTRRGRSMSVRLEVWSNLIMRAKRAWPMHRHPFTVVRVTCHDEAGHIMFRRPMWLAIFGARRGEVTARQAQAVYHQRFHQEHMHRFGRQRLLLDAFQTPETQREENWLVLVGLAYAQLFAARRLAVHLPRPWERQQPVDPDAVASPTTVMRNMPRILGQSGTPARAPKPRGNAPGRAKGVSPPRRRRYPVICKRQQAA